MYHIVAGKLAVEEISQMKTAKTIQGQELKIDAHKWHLHMNPKINDANITITDIITDNGMIQVLDKVLMPNMELTCPEDGMGFMTMEALNAHTKTGHEVEKTMQTMSVTSSQEIPLRGVEPNQTSCPICGKSFKNISQMERHRDTVHHETKGHE